MYQGKGFRRPELEASETRNIQLFRRLSSKELLLLRVVVLAFLTLLVNVALTMADSGRVELKASRLNFSLSGDTLWAGYVLVAAAASVCVWMFFYNHVSSRVHKLLGEAVCFFFLASWLLAAFLGGDLLPL